MAGNHRTLGSDLRKLRCGKLSEKRTAFGCGYLIGHGAYCP